MGYIGKEGSSDGKEDSKDAGKDGSNDAFMPLVVDSNQEEVKEMSLLNMDYGLEKPIPKPGNIFYF